MLEPKKEPEEYTDHVFICDSLNSDLEEFPRVNPEVNTTVFFWSSNATKLLIGLYQKYRSKVGCTRMKNFRCMWEVVAKKLTEQMETEISAKNCENRWKVLERNYKKWVDNKNSIGRGRKHFEFGEEMQVIYREINPERSDTQHVPANLTEKNVLKATEETPTREEVSNRISRGELLRRRAVKKKKAVLEQMRDDKLRYQEKKLNFLREAHRETMALMQERNELEKERNKILQEKKCRCDNL